jgi:hypothetical protein
MHTRLLRHGFPAHTRMPGIDMRMLSEGRHGTSPDGMASTGMLSEGVLRQFTPYRQKMFDGRRLSLGEFAYRESMKKAFRKWGWNRNPQLPQGPLCCGSVRWCYTTRAHMYSRSTCNRTHCVYAHMLIVCTSRY